LVAEKGEVLFQDALGFAVVEPEKIEANFETIYDLASLTKPLVTGLICAMLVESDEIHLSDKIAKYFSGFATEEKREITIENLVTHTSGFKGWKPFYLSDTEGSAKETVRSQILVEPLEYAVDSKVVYSDFNFILLGFLIEKIYGSPLDKIAQKLIFEPLKLRNTFFNPPDHLRKEIAASEKGNEFEKDTCLDLGYIEPSTSEEISDKSYKSPFREDVIWGEVHDNNCYFMGGVAGHAGLFSNVGETLKMAQQFLHQSSGLLKPETCKLLKKNFTPKLNQARSFSFQLAETKDSTASETLDKNSFGHLGFTGTSVWIEPNKQRIFILLTNRTHNRDLPLADLKLIRQEFHSVATKLLDK